MRRAVIFSLFLVLSILGWLFSMAAEPTTGALDRSAEIEWIELLMSPKHPAPILRPDLVPSTVGDDWQDLIDATWGTGDLLFINSDLYTLEALLSGLFICFLIPRCFFRLSPGLFIRKSSFCNDQPSQH